jgi:hypothetical protein
MISSFEPNRKSTKTKFSSDPSDKQREKQKQKTREEQRKSKRNWLD